MKDGLYHSSLPNFPKLNDMLGFPVRLSHHAREQLWFKYGIKDFDPKTIDVLSKDVFELEVQDSKPVKLCFRINYNNTQDMCIVLTNQGVIKTIWLNRKNDTHNTLDVSKYAS